MSKHTPGPWTVFADVNIQGGKDGRRGIATTGGTVDGRASDQGLAENLANAVLIAAVLDLLEALEGLIELQNDTEMTYEDAYQSMFKSPGRDAWEAARAAVAKATGP